MILVESNLCATHLFIKSGTGYDLHYLVWKKLDEESGNIDWHCWHLSKEFFEAIEKHGLPPTNLNYDKLMKKLGKKKILK